MLAMHRSSLSCAHRRHPHINPFLHNKRSYPSPSLGSTRIQSTPPPPPRFSTTKYNDVPNSRPTVVVPAVRTSQTSQRTRYPWSTLLRPLAVTLFFTGTSFGASWYLDSHDTPLGSDATDPDRKLKFISAIIALNFCIFAGLAASPISPLAMGRFGIGFARFAVLDPRTVRERPITVFTHGLSHSEFWHIGLNMMGFYSFGMAVYDKLGGFQFLAVYGSALCWSGMGQLALGIYRARKGGPVMPALGASGGIYTLLGLVAWYAPNSSVYLIFLPFVPIKLGTAFAGMMTMDMVGLVRGWSTFGHAAHFTGGALGVAYGAAAVPDRWIQQRRESMRRYLSRWGR